MNEETVSRRNRDATLDRAAEEYLRQLAAGQIPNVADFALRYGVSEIDLRAFERDYQWFASLTRQISHQEGVGSPTVVKLFGDYELEGKPIGRGGMGVVYKARQISLDRTVAVKLIVAGVLASPAEIRRFYEEARLAGRLQHPNIVAIHAVGCLEGQHFYSMDYIDGQTLDTLIDEQGQISTNVVADYLLTSAQAVAYAHCNGIIHRDLKPSNILIDTSNQPQLTDFGLAKQLRGDSQATETHGVLGTPSYMAPEQARGDAKAVDERSDVYGMGAVLYKALTGIPPFQGASPLDILKQVALDEPRRPRLLNAKVPLDLETICLKCLQKDPSSRYASAAALVEDLARFRRGEPIKARPIGPLQRVAMWGRRRPLVSALGALLAASIIGGFIGIGIQYMRAEIALQDARSNLARAESNLVNAVEALEFVGHEIGEVELPAVPRVQQLQRRILERAVEFNEALLQSNRDDRRARWESGLAHLRIADLQTTLGNYDAAERSYRRCMEILNVTAVTKSKDSSEKRLLMRAQYGLANLLIDRHRFDEAEAHLRFLNTAIAEFPEEAMKSSEWLELRSALQSLEGRQRIHENRLNEAEACLRGSLATLEKLVERNGSQTRLDGDLARRYLSLGLVLRKKGLTDEAIEAYQRALRLFQGLGSEDQLSTTWRDLAIAYRKEGELAKALAAYTEAKKILTALVQFSPDSVKLQTELAEALHGTALVYQDQGQINEAIPLLLDAVAAQRNVVALAPEVVDYQLRLRNQLYSLSAAYVEIRDHVRAAEVVDDFLESAVAPIDHVNAALTFIACQTVVTSDLELAEDGRRTLGEEYAQRAIQVLQAARESGLITAEFVESDHRFDSLNSYRAFSDLKHSTSSDASEAATTR